MPHRCQMQNIPANLHQRGNDYATAALTELIYPKIRIMGFAGLVNDKYAGILGKDGIFRQWPMPRYPRTYQNSLFVLQGLRF